MTKQKKKVGIWLRVSTQMQVDETDSLEHHKVRAEAYCQAKGWKVAKTYTLPGLSGKNVMDYPQTHQMLADVKAGVIDTLIFSALARLARNTRQLLSIADIFEKHGASLVSLKEAIDTTTPAGRMFFTVNSALATFESEEISERIKASVVTRAKMGKIIGKPPFGYRKKGHSLELDPKEAPIRREMYEIFLETKRKATTAKILNERGYRTRRGYKFSDKLIDSLLKDPIAIGKKRQNYTRTLDGGRAWELKPESEWIYTKVPALISEEVFRAIQNILKASYKPRKRKARLPVHPFSGVTYCCCQKEKGKQVKMRVLSSIPDKYTCPKCRAKIPTEDLEFLYKEQLKNFILSPKQLSEYLKSADDVLQDKKEQLEVSKKEHEQLREKFHKTLNLYTNDKISENTFSKEIEPFESRMNALGTVIEDLQEQIQTLEATVVNNADIAELSRSLHEQWNTLKKKEKIQLIAHLTDRITVCKEKVEIALHFL